MRKTKRLFASWLIAVLIIASVRSPVIADAEETYTETQTESQPMDEAITDDVEPLTVTETESEVTVETKSPVDLEKPEDTLVVRRVDSDDGIQTYSVGDYGINHGMFKLYTSIITVIELGPKTSDPYSHIIQLDTNGDGDYSDVTYTAYCIQYGELSPGGNYLTESTLTVTQHKYIGYALAYGWRQTGTSYDENQYTSNTAKSEYAVTQGIIWCCSQGKFNTSEGESAMTKIINASYDPTHARTYYNTLKSTILNAETKPSFDGQTLTLEWSDANKRYEKTITDTNGILSYYNYAYSGISFSRSGNTLTVYTTNTYPSAVTASASRTVYGGENSVVCWDAWYDLQDMATYTSYSQTLKSTLKIQTKTRTGYAKLKKSSSNTEVTNGNACYSLAGAVYGVYSDSSCKTLVGKLTTTASGDTNALELTAGTYYAKELTAPTGYYLDTKVHKLTVTAGNTTTLKVSDIPQYDPMRVLLQKYDLTTSTATTQGDGSLAKAEFTIKYYSGLWDKSVDPATLGKKAERSWVFATDSDGLIYYDNEYKISGDEFYYMDGAPFIPRGTITIQETKAPEGYLINDTVYVFQMLPGSTAGVSTWNIKEIPEQVIRGNFSFTKNGEDGFPLSGVRFKITSKTTGENHVVTSDRFGRVTTDDIWFGAGEKDDSQESLPYDTYIVEELRCDANFYYQLVEPFEVVIDKDNVTKDLGIVVDYYFPQPEITTSATGKDTGTHDITAQPDVTIVDTVSYKNLVAGRTYTVKGVLMDKSTGEPLLINNEEITAELTFVPEETDGSIELSYTFDATGFDTDVVVYERLYDEKGKLMASHTDLEDTDQTVKILKPDLGTKASDETDDDKAVFEDDEVTIVDTVSYTRLTPGRTYTVKGVLMDKATGEPLLINDEEITAELVFTPESSDGSVELTYMFDASELGGKTIVVFESLYHMEKEIASHADIEDEDQTVEVLEPSITTTAKNVSDNSKEICAAGEVTVVDTVSFTNLIPEREYTLKGILMDKTTGEPLLIDGEEVTAELAFTPKETNGTVDVTYTFDAVGLKEMHLVVFETLYLGEREAAVHKDLDDIGQTVKVLEPSITTTAKNAADNSKEICAAGDVTMVDTVSFTNLIPDREYTLKGILMDKATGEPLLIDDEEITEELVFTPEETDGTIDVTYTFDATGLDETELVVYETLYHNDKTVATHTDIDDAGQTVTVLKPDITTSAYNQTDEKKTLTAEGTVTIVDVVAYTNLIPGMKYTVKGILMDKATGEPLLINDKEVTAELVFTPESSNGTVNMTYTFDASGLGKRTVVVFESLYREEKEVVTHADIDDAGQTVVFKAPPEKPKTGDYVNIRLFLSICSIALLVMIFTYKYKKVS